MIYYYYFAIAALILKILHDLDKPDRCYQDKTTNTRGVNEEASCNGSEVQGIPARRNPNY